MKKYKKNENEIEKIKMIEKKWRSEENGEKINKKAKKKIKNKQKKLKQSRIVFYIEFLMHGCKWIYQNIAV